jgi:hypothetical protein
MGTKSFVQIEINAVFTTTSGKMQFRSGVFDHFKSTRISFSYALRLEIRIYKFKSMYHVDMQLTSLNRISQDICRALQSIIACIS